MDIHWKADGIIGKNFVSLKPKDTFYLRSGMLIFASYVKILAWKKINLDSIVSMDVHRKADVSLKKILSP